MPGPRGREEGRDIWRVLNDLRQPRQDIAYYYESYIPAFDAGAPVEGRLSRVVEPRTRIGAKVNFSEIP
jgi:hypothetical protein